jgi:hypothetical protein
MAPRPQTSPNLYADAVITLALSCGSTSNLSPNAATPQPDAGGNASDSGSIARDSGDNGNFGTYPCCTHSKTFTRVYDSAVAANQASAIA